MNDDKHPCRLSVYLAREAPVAAILRRGPNEWAQLTSWHRDTDNFEHGQWFHGRVYERRCDISPDGTLFVYIAAKQGPRHDPDDIGTAWTAISHPPYFTALALWRNLGTWYGGGAFVSNRKLLLDATCSFEPHPKFKPKGIRIAPCPADSAPWERRLLLGGWNLVERGFHPRTHRRVGQREIWERPCPGDGPKLCREVEDADFSRYGGIYADNYWLETGDDIFPLGDIGWADWDSADRLAFVRGGKLYAARWTGWGLEETCLFDFNPLEPDPQPSPMSARHW